MTFAEFQATLQGARKVANDVLDRASVRYQLLDSTALYIDFHEAADHMGRLCGRARPRIHYWNENVRELECASPRALFAHGYLMAQVQAWVNG